MELSNTGENSLPPCKMHTRRRRSQRECGIFVAVPWSFLRARCGLALSRKDGKLPATRVTSGEGTVVPGGVGGGVRQLRSRRKTPLGSSGSAAPPLAGRPLPSDSPRPGPPSRLGLLRCKARFFRGSEPLLIQPPVYSRIFPGFSPSPPSPSCQSSTQHVRLGH